MLGQTHGPAEDHAFGLNEDSRRIFNFDFRHSGLFEDVAPVNRSQRCFEFFEPGSVLLDELLIKDLARSALFSVEQFLHDPFQQSHIAIDSHLQKEISQLRTFTQPGPNFLRMFEARQSRLRQRIDVHDFAAAPLGMQQ